MATGIGLLGVITAALASWFVEKVAEVRANEARTQADISDVLAEVRVLRDEMRRRAEDAPPQAERAK